MEVSEWWVQLDVAGTWAVVEAKSDRSGWVKGRGLGVL